MVDKNKITFKEKRHGTSDGQNNEDIYGQVVDFVGFLGILLTITTGIWIFRTPLQSYVSFSTIIFITGLWKSRFLL